MFDNKSPYTLRTENTEGITRYYVSFTDGQAIHRETEVSRSVYQEFQRFVKTERNLRRWDERHTEQSELSDETLHSRAVDKPQSAEDAAFDSLRNEYLWRAIQTLPEMQRRRFVLYYEFGLTYEQIAQIEGCTKMAVKYSIDNAVKAIKESLEKFLKNRLYF